VLEDSKSLFPTNLRTLICGRLSRSYRALGFKTEGILRQHTLHPERGDPVDHIVFAMLRDEWLASRERSAA
jgi:hypothetical protein